MPTMIACREHGDSISSANKRNRAPLGRRTGAKNRESGAACRGYRTKSRSADSSSSVRVCKFAKVQTAAASTHDLEEAQHFLLGGGQCGIWRCELVRFERTLKSNTNAENFQTFAQLKKALFTATSKVAWLLAALMHRTACSHREIVSNREEHCGRRGMRRNAPGAWLRAA